MQGRTVVAISCWLVALLLAGPAPPAIAEEATDYRAIIATALDHPFITDADVEMYYGDTRGLVTCRGGPVLVRYPGITG